MVLWGWPIENFKGINLTLYMHKILLEYKHNSVKESQRRLDLTMKEMGENK